MLCVPKLHLLIGTHLALCSLIFRGVQFSVFHHFPFVTVIFIVRVLTDMQFKKYSVQGY
jgi:hypothetical protein